MAWTLSISSTVFCFLVPLLLTVSSIEARPLVFSFDFGRSLLGSWRRQTPTPTPTVCNGFAEFCDRSYGNITYVGSHDSFAFSRDPFSLARTQSVDIPTQLSLGARLLQAQSHIVNGTLHFCHTSCGLFDGGTVLSYLFLVKTFLSTNPTEVLTLLFTNPEGHSVQTIWEPLFREAGLVELIYVPPSIPVSRLGWPTLGEMVATGKRLVVFMDYWAEAGTSFILPEFQMIWENGYGATSPSFPCSIDRISGPFEASDHMYLLNHVLNNELATGVSFSDPANVTVTNSATSITKNVEECLPLGSGFAPNFILLDYVHVGDAVEVVDKLNGVTRPKPSNTSTTSSPMITGTISHSGDGSIRRPRLIGTLVLCILVGVLVGMVV